MADPRLELRQALSEAASSAELVELVKAATSLKRVEMHELKCSKCRQTSIFRVEVLDAARSAKALEGLLDQAHGKPAETKTINLVARTAAELEAMSDEDLLELVGAEDAVWEEPSQP